MCSTWFVHQNELLRHIKLYHNDKNRITCLDCGKISCNNRIFIAHYRTEHMTKDDSYDCSVCNKTFVDAHKFTTHLIAVHKKDNFHSCEHCGKHFNTSSRLNEHLLMHTVGFKCNRCPKSYARAHSLRKHKEKAHSTM